VHGTGSGPVALLHDVVEDVNVHEVLGTLLGGREVVLHHLVDPEKVKF
jgi:hypothetical protein